MGKKRKSDESRLDEVNRTLYSTFCNAANSLSQIYAHAMSQQTHAFHSGERHALEKLYQWVVRHHAEGARMTAADIVSYLQNELNTDGNVIPALPDQNHQPASLSTSSNQVIPSRSTIIHDDQSKNAVFSNALSSPVRRSLQPYHIALGEDFNAVDVGARNGCNAREANSHDSSMDMHSDSPAHDSY